MGLAQIAELHTPSVPSYLAYIWGPGFKAAQGAEWPSPFRR